ncbi:hypothetical protein [Amycolatopsis saalfeldensis]|uniref:Uncharacterized protein n=1 Tax=Amycolatopsis saalfeldensis TaxID=394193 RepID=A0A1H8YFJ8_9PSEU|nr:hypothetical protein [Amycolatopsis saalfeldensis]SEP50915.1 hypothetical protein SAMN04489732_11568 [Amycolatopsis saalfeldensis]
MWLALGTPVFLMVGAVLMERVEQRCAVVQRCAEAPARSRVRVAEPAPEREVRRPLAVVGGAPVWS